MKHGPILVFGAAGQVGWELQRSLSLLGEVMPLTRRQVDLADADAVRTAIRASRPAVIVNAGAYTAVDQAETEVELAHAINATAPAVMAEEARASDIPLVHYSTDYVYDGEKRGLYVETDKPNPQSVYGASKLAGDEAIQASGARFLILRTTWVFAARGNNFLKTILRLAREREQLRIVADQVGTPTSAELLADVTALALRRLFSGQATGGLYHCTAAGETSWHGYARFIVEEALRLGLRLKTAPERIDPISTEAYPVPASRPANSLLDCSRLEQDFDLILPAWQTHVTRTLKELIAR